MILETLLIAVACFSVGGLFEIYQRSEKSLNHQPLDIEPVLSTRTKLVIELLRFTDDWIPATLWSSANGGLEHDTGVAIRPCPFGYGLPPFHHEMTLAIRDSEDNWEYYECLPLADRKAILSEFDAYKARQRDRRDRAVTQALAKRVLERANVSGSLGRSETARLVPSSDDSETRDSLRLNSPGPVLCSVKSIDRFSKGDPESVIRIYGTPVKYDSAIHAYRMLDERS